MQLNIYMKDHISELVKKILYEDMIDNHSYTQLKQIFKPEKM